MSLIPPDPVSGVDSGDEPQICAPEHCFHAFDALFCALTSKKPIPPVFPDDKYPLFVTWNTRSSRHGRAPRLRGCIGNFDPLPLHKGLAEYALISAFRDTRFNKIEEWELESLECGISLLTDFEDASSYLDWSIDRSEAPSPLSSTTSIPTRSYIKHSYSATYLPQIAPEQGWDKIETVDSAIRKAGWNGRITEDIRRSVKLRRYQSRKCTVGWEEYVQWRKLNGGRI
ncbi:unnamed protein product [Somion occarium]|uniref:AMMECR1 domain-containing protein n=1 Tax=Somion occarium TaxID=3059160 RepID=A0ABP1D0B9_9APHY